MRFVIWGIILGVKSDADFENDICNRTSPRLGVVLVGFDVNGVVFSLSASVILDIILPLTVMLSTKILSSS